ncbi:GNAT family N-acetyltransferase [Streptomyces venezuelae]|uniref:GNAT family N-acetyltransferase n=1 Tax=Streptomyces venezuelae TaxID=54571 RepID=A0A5P2D2V1_STRVZ|nr:GNAT family N-acetyltransferase [Streptomyces venezuelae]QES48527.1 GNAT family N-acetyltransferase [Streptomyces venezuelae]
MEPTALTTERLLVRPYVPADVPEVHAACQDPGIQRWIPVPVPYRRDDAEIFVTEKTPAGWQDDSEYNFAVRLKADGLGGEGPLGGEGLGGEGPLVAAVGLVPRGTDAHEIGYWAVAAHRGRGYTAEAVLAVARWAFTEAGCVRLVWRAGTGNTASRAVAEKAGFRIEGVARAGMEHRGTLRDCRVGALLPSDLGLPSRLPYLPTPEPAAVSAGS